MVAKFEKNLPPVLSKQLGDFSNFGGLFRKAGLYPELAIVKALVMYSVYSVIG